MAIEEKKLLLLFLTVLVITADITTAAMEEKLIDAMKMTMFVDELEDMPRIQGYTIDENCVKGPKHIQIGMFHKLWKFHRDLPPTPVFAYGTSRSTATVPGPTIEALHGVDTYVTWQNYLPPKHILPWDPTIPTAIPRDREGIPTVVHIHGAIAEPQSDGHADCWFTAGFRETGPKWTNRTYHYHNNQHPGNLWYHDHAMGLTRVNILAGLVGAYIIRDPDLENPLRLPSGDQFDRALVVFDRRFHSDGSIFMNSTGNNPGIHTQWRPEYFGDAIVVNGKAWPYMHVRRRKYRFRIINASNARFFRLFFTNGLRITHIGADSVYLEKPVSSTETLLAPSEIIDVVVDFAQSISDTAVLANDAPYPFPSGNPVTDTTTRVMKFIIDQNLELDLDPSHVPPNLIQYPAPDLSSAAATRYISMYEYTSDTNEPMKLYLNAKPYSSPATETPKPGTGEIWYVINLTADNHPLHIHLGLFVVLEQTRIEAFETYKSCMMKIHDALQCGLQNHAIGEKVEAAAPEKGWKNVYKMAPGYVTKIFVKFSFIHSNSSYPFDATAEPGYVYHCHILDHEDNEMMRPLKFIQ